jgi:hypothetical protein
MLIITSTRNLNLWMHCKASRGHHPFLLKMQQKDLIRQLRQELASMIVVIHQVIKFKTNLLLRARKYNTQGFQVVRLAGRATGPTSQLVVIRRRFGRLVEPRDLHGRRRRTASWRRIAGRAAGCCGTGWLHGGRRRIAASRRAAQHGFTADGVGLASSRWLLRCM